LREATFSRALGTRPGRGPKADPRLGVVLYDGVEPLDVAGTIGVVSMAARVLAAIEAVTIARAVGPVALAGGSLATARHRCVTGLARLPAFDAGGGQKRPAQPLCRRHLIETTARPFLPHPRQRVYRIGPGWACRAKPKWEWRRRLFPQIRRRSFPRSAPVAPPDDVAAAVADRVAG
jgi:hypothetical protein